MVSASVVSPSLAYNTYHIPLDMFSKSCTLVKQDVEFLKDRFSAGSIEYMTLSTSSSALGSSFNLVI